jgi:hypothetical protein
MRLGQDAADMRNQAGNTFNTNLNDVSAIPAPTPPSWWQDFVDFFNNKFVQIFVDIAIAVVSIFCPVVGLALGAVLFGLSTAINITSGHFDVGAFVVGLLTLAVGAGVATGFIDTVKIFGAVSKVGENVGSFFSKLTGTAEEGIGDSASAVADASGSGADAAGAAANAGGKLGSSTLGKSAISFGKSFGANFAFDSVTGLAGKGIEDGIDGKQFTGQDAAAIFAGAAAGGVAGGAFSAAKTGLGFDPVTPSESVSGDDGSSTSGEVSTTGSVAGSDVGHAYPDDASSTYSEVSTTGGYAGSHSPAPSETSSPQTPGSPVEPSQPNLPHPQTPSETPPSPQIPGSHPSAPSAPSSPQTPGSPVEPSQPNLPYPHTPPSAPLPGGSQGGPLPPLPGGSQGGPLPPLPGDTDKPLPPPGWAGAAFDQGGRVGNDVANAGVEIAVGQAIGNTTGHQADPAGQQANAYGYLDLPALAVGDISALAPSDDLGASDISNGVIEPVEGE